MSIDTLVDDINKVLEHGLPPEQESRIKDFGDRLGQTIAQRLVRTPREPTLRMSNIGKPCGRQLWYEINTPEDGEKLRPETYMKFLYGDILEELLLFLAEVAGHEVTGRQKESEIAGIKGHRDAVIDGTLVDVKSASSYSFQKFSKSLSKDEDAFGYLTQLGSYLEDAQLDDGVIDKTQAAFLVVDKTLGHITLDKQARTDIDFEKYFEERKSMVAQAEPPARAFEDVPMSKTSPNKKLGINCSYCAFKKKCWPQARTFLYSTGPVTLTKVVYEPNVPEVK